MIRPYLPYVGTTVFLFNRNTFYQHQAIGISFKGPGVIDLVAFYFQNLCFINQINAGDEWLVIRDVIAFESLTAGAMGYEEFRDWIECVFTATEEELRRLEYTSEQYELKWRF